MINVKTRILILVLLLTFAIKTGGCMESRMHLTVEKDGSGIIDITVEAEKAIIERAESLAEINLEGLGETLEQEGFELETYETNNKSGFKATRHVESLEDFYLEEETKDPEVIESEIDFHEKEGFLFDTHHFQAEVDPGKITGELMEERGLLSFLAPDFSFALTLPVEPEEHNADHISEDGKTLEWEIDPYKKNLIKASIKTPNPANLALLTGSVFIIVLLPVYFAARRRKKPSKQV